MGAVAYLIDNIGITYSHCMCPCTYLAMQALTTLGVPWDVTLGAAAG